MIDVDIEVDVDDNQGHRPLLPFSSSSSYPHCLSLSLSDLLTLLMLLPVARSLLITSHHHFHQPTNK